MTTHDVLVVGLGAMGGPMAANLGRSRDVRLSGLDPSVDHLPGDVSWHRVASVGEGVTAGGVVMLSLPSIDVVETVCAELLSGSALPAVVIDTSTSDPERTRALAQRCAERGVAYLDAPVARGRGAAASGELLMTVGGDEEVLESVRPVLSVVATDIVHCGPVGAGQTAKILNNMVMLMNVSAVVEAIAIAARHDIDAATVVQLLRAGSANSFALSGDPGTALAEDDFPAGKFAVDYALKDARLAEALAAGATPEGLRVVIDLLAQVSEVGESDAYYPVMLHARLPRDPGS